MVAVEQDHPGAGAQDRPLEAPDRLLEPVEADQAADRRGLAAGDDEPVEAVELLGLPHLDDVGAEAPQHRRVLAEIPLHSQHSDRHRPDSTNTGRPASLGRCRAPGAPARRGARSARPRRPRTRRAAARASSTASPIRAALLEQSASPSCAAATPGHPPWPRPATPATLESLLGPLEVTGLLIAERDMPDRVRHQQAVAGGACTLVRLVKERPGSPCSGTTWCTSPTWKIDSAISASSPSSRRIASACSNSGSSSTARLRCGRAGTRRGASAPSGRARTPPPPDRRAHRLEPVERRIELVRSGPGRAGLVGEHEDALA